MIDVLIADDQPVVRSGLRMLCDSTDDITVVGEASDGRAVLETLRGSRADVVLMDLRMPRLDGIAATELLVREHPGTRVLVLTTFDDDEHVYPALAAGASGFLGKHAAPDELLAAIRRTARDEPVFSPEVLRRIVGAAVDNRTRTGAVADLTEREGEVLALVGDGLSNAEIAARLYIGTTTVKSHIASLMNKTGATNRVRLAVLAVQH